MINKNYLVHNFENLLLSESKKYYHDFRDIFSVSNKKTCEKILKNITVFKILLNELYYNNTLL